MDKRINNLSVALYRTLVKVGASERLRDIHQQTATTGEILHSLGDSVITNGIKTVYNCGSSFEGSVTPDLASDVDQIRCNDYPPVVFDVVASPPGPAYLVVRDVWTPPGYCKLQILGNGQFLEGRGMVCPCCHDVDNFGRACLKHIKGDNMQGPADAHYHDGVHTLDDVIAFRCEILPASSLEWIERPRPYNFPSNEQLHRMSRLGCMFVGVGHVNSSEHELEWRMSYTLQERILMSGLNPTQHKVYILLKMIKNNIFIDEFHEDSLSSYHFKTCILYAVQMTPVRVWTPFNLINCLLQCLKLMNRWLKAGQCPSFLIKDQNLFTKLRSIRVRRRLLEVMRFIFQGGIQFLHMLHSDSVGAILRDGDNRMFRELRVKKKNAYLFKLKERLVRLVHINTFPLIQNISGGRFDPFSIKQALNILHQEWQIDCHTSEETYSAFKHLFPKLHLHIAMGLASIAVDCQDINLKDRLEQLVECHLYDGRLSDLVNKRLAMSTFMYAGDKYEECFLILQKIEQEFTYDVALYCPCTRSTVIPVVDIRDRQLRERKYAKLPIQQIISSHSACCFVFLPSAAALVPAPLRYEMERSLGTPPGSRDERKHFWFDWAVVDARVYLYFLQYLVSSKLQKNAYRQVARDNLYAEIFKADMYVRQRLRPFLSHRETAYNLLGWIYMQEGRLTEAYACFVKSLKIRPLHNAAKFHARDLFALTDGQ